MLSFTGFLIFNLSGCQDPLGVETNVNKIPLFDTTRSIVDTTKKDTTRKDTTKKDTVFPNVRIKTNDISLSISETVYKRDNTMMGGLIGEVPWRIKFNAKSAVIDTSEINSRLWLVLDFENTALVDTMGNEIIAHTSAIRIKLDSLKGSGFYNLNQDLNSSQWSALFLEFYPNKKINAYPGISSPLTFQIIEDTRTRTSGQIKALIKFDGFVDHAFDHERKQLIKFEATLIIKYQI